MKYISTRGDKTERGFAEILLEGLAPDGGLYLPTSYPKIDDATLTKLGITDLPEVGDEYQLTAIAKVTRISSSADEKEQENRLTLQLTQMSLEDSDEATEPNASCVKSLLTNSMR